MLNFKSIKSIKKNKYYKDEYISLKDSVYSENILINNLNEKMTPEALTENIRSFIYA